MPLQPGEILGHFEILAHIGAGGMGDVYKARDTRLHRIVAIKTSKAAFTERFSREARAVASLNHPNIASLYDVGPDYLVMEFVDGAPLKGPLSSEQALPIAKQIAEAIEAAHDKAIIHRDLKPGNILLREDGTVKVLDFGLAKALEDEPAQAPGADSPTLTMHATEMGMILGTAAYMSPEQAKGKKADRRADIFSYGVVLYELLSGKHLFKGETVGDILASVIKEESKLDTIPANWRPLLTRCLEKDPRRRLQSIGEARILLDDGLPMPGQAAPPAAPSASRLSWVLAGALALTAAAFAFLYFSRPQPAQPPEVHFRIQAPENVRIVEFRLSPDGRILAFSGEQGGVSNLWVRPLNSLEAKLIPGTTGARRPFWSPDSAFVGFDNDGRLKRVPVSGGPPQTLAEGISNSSWGSAGVIVGQKKDGFYRLSADGGEAVQFLKTPGPSTNYQFPEFLPDGRRFLFLANSDQPALTGLYAGSLAGSAPVKLLPDLTAASYLPIAGTSAGYLLFRRDSFLMAQPFDPATLHLSGLATPLAEEVNSGSTIGAPTFSNSSVGSIAFQQATRTPDVRLIWRDRSGKSLGTIGQNGPMGSANLSPDGKQVAIELHDRQAGNGDVWIQDLARGIRSRLTQFNNISVWGPLWSPDGSQVMFSVRLGPNTRDIYRQRVSGTSKEELLVRAGTNGRPEDWSPDGQTVLYSQTEPNEGSNLYLLPLEADRKPTPYLKTKASEFQGRFAPNGKWMAYISDESGQNQVYVQSIPAGETKVTISKAGGQYPHWRPDGKELFFVSPEGKLMAVRVSLSPKFEAGAPQELFGGLRYDLSYNPLSYHPAADGQRFLILEEDRQQAASSLTVILNWRPGREN